MSGLAAVRSALRAARVRCRIDARRPASWLGLAAAASVGVAGGRWPEAWWPAVPILSGAFAAAAAIGGPPRGAPGLVPAWVATRALWPLAGAVGAVAIGRADPATAAWVCAAAVATGAVVALALERSASPGEAASLALVAVLAAVAVGGFVRETWPDSGVGGALAGAAAWAAVVGGTAFATRRLGFEASAADVPAVEAGALGSIGRLWLHAAMLSALAGMVAWLVLAPHAPWRYALLATGWFAGAAVPLATLGPGSGGEAGRRRVAATAARRVGRWWPSGATGPGANATAVATAATFAAILGWPPLVAALIAGDDPARGWNLLAAAAPGGCALATAAIATGVTAGGGTRDTAHAAALAVAVAAGIAVGFALGVTTP